VNGERTILIVDDDVAVVQTFARMLRLSGYHVLTAADVDSAWREIAVEQPDAVLLDLRLPKIDGITFLAQLRARQPERHTPVAIITGDYFVDEQIDSDLRDLDAPVYFKPLWLEDLTQIVERLVGSNGSNWKREMTHSFATRQRRHSVLLIDDSLAQLDLYQMLLEPDFDISRASRGADGITLAARQQPDAIVLDITMPGMDGWETCTRMKCLADTADIPVILLTAVDDHDLSQHALAVGANAVLQKPCPADRLRETILRAVGEAASDAK
jgi:CheY-like chemotaxis protein